MYRFIVETAANSDNVRTGAKMLTIICALKLFPMVEKIQTFQIFGSYQLIQPRNECSNKFLLKPSTIEHRLY